MTLLRLSPTDPGTLVRAWLPSCLWVTAAEMAKRTGLSVGQVGKVLAEMFKAGEAMRRPGTWGREWKRIKRGVEPQEKIMNDKDSTPPNLTHVAIVSEIRNALVPARHHLGRMGGDTSSIEAALRGIGRVLTLADEICAWLDAKERAS